jgi:hypothetical protein
VYVPLVVDHHTTPQGWIEAVQAMFTEFSRNSTQMVCTIWESAEYHILTKHVSLNQVTMSIVPDSSYTLLVCLDHIFQVPATASEIVMFSLPSGIKQ